MVKPSVHPQIEENYHALMLAYAAGVLNQAQSLAVAVHMAMSPQARQIVRQCEAIGAALMECECEPQAMRGNALDNVLAKIDAAPKQPPRPRAHVMLPPEIRIPLSLLDRVACRPCQPQWKRVFTGLHICDLPLECRESRVQFIKGQPSAKMPAHTHRTMEITLVLDGAYEDEMGLHRRGDLVVLDADDDHQTQACRKNGVVAMVVSDAPVKFSGLAALLNPFLK
jgi:putative transcriptional regulator